MSTDKNKQDERCANCKFWFDEAQVCRRFPEYINRSSDDWCGEFFGKSKSVESLELTLEELGLIKRTQKILKNFGVKTLNDVLLFRCCYPPTVDIHARRDVESSLIRFGIVR